MYNPAYTHLQVELSKRLNELLQSFQEYYFKKIVDNNLRANFLLELQYYCATSKEGRIFLEAQDALENFRRKIL